MDKNEQRACESNPRQDEVSGVDCGGDGGGGGEGAGGDHRSRVKRSQGYKFRFGF